MKAVNFKMLEEKRATSTTSLIFIRSSEQFQKSTPVPMEIYLIKTNKQERNKKQSLFEGSSLTDQKMKRDSLLPQ